MAQRQLMQQFSPTIRILPTHLHLTSAIWYPVLPAKLLAFYWANVVTALLRFSFNRDSWLSAL